MCIRDRLVATIDAPAPGLTLLPGQTVDLAGSASGGLAPYTFEWSSEVNGTLGQGETLSGVSLSADTRASSYGPNQITPVSYTHLTLPTSDLV